MIEYDNDNTTLNWLLPVTKSLNLGAKIDKIEIRECEILLNPINPIK